VRPQDHFVRTQGSREPAWRRHVDLPCPEEVCDRLRNRVERNAVRSQNANQFSIFALAGVNGWSWAECETNHGKMTNRASTK
jgi:hypothetical protein